MDVLVHADGFRLRDEVRSAVEYKIGGLEQYAPRALRANVHLRRVSSHHNDKEFQAKVLIELPGRDVSGEETASQPMEAVDLLVEKIENQLRRRKESKLDAREKVGRKGKAILQAEA